MLTISSKIQDCLFLIFFLVVCFIDIGLEVGIKLTFLVKDDLELPPASASQPV